SRESRVRLNILESADVLLIARRSSAVVCAEVLPDNQRPLFLQRGVDHIY
ncbi:unnamed protein product, partial [Hymenolepis diminuta]